MEIPEPLQLFFSHLFNIDKDLFNENTTKTTNSYIKILRMKSIYQMMYYNLFHGFKKPPLQVMTGVAVHNICRSRTIIDSLNHTGLVYLMMNLCGITMLCLCMQFLFLKIKRRSQVIS